MFKDYSIKMIIKLRQNKLKSLSFIFFNSILILFNLITEYISPIKSLITCSPQSQQIKNSYEQKISQHCKWGI